MSGFRTSDVKRVQMALDAAIPDPFEATVTLEDGRNTIRAAVVCPESGNAVTSATWPFQTGKTMLKTLQPTEDDLAYTVARMRVHCLNWSAAPAEPAPVEAVAEEPVIPEIQPAEVPESDPEPVPPPADE